MKLSEQIIIFIYGRTGSGKTPFAERISKIAADRGYSAVTSDHALFAFNDDYEEERARWLDILKKSGADFAILTVTTEPESEFTVEILPYGASSMRLMDLLTGEEII